MNELRYMTCFVFRTADVKSSEYDLRSYGG